jgi:predicted nucleotidyltransferase
MKFGLKDYMVTAIQSCLAHYPRIEEAILYGSRAMGTFRPGSDIDLTLKGKQLTLSDVFRLENEIDDLLLPYTFDISIYHQISNAELLDHINRKGVLFYRNAALDGRLSGTNCLR